MDAHLIRIALALSVFTSAGATFRTRNFVVTAPTAEIAKQVGMTAERSRAELAVAWLGKELRTWYKPCPIKVKVGQIGAGGATTFAFDRGEVFGWRMNVQGSLERILDSVVPHEVSHTIFASYFRRPLPRWADEGAATLVEHESERRRQQLMLDQVMKTNRRYSLRKLLAITEYPSGMQNVLTLYAQGYSLADFLVQKGGRPRYLRFLEDAHRRGWDHAIQTHYAFKNVEALDKTWNGWVMAGSPRINLPAGVQLADASRREKPSRVVIRSQNPDGPPVPSNRQSRPGGNSQTERDLAASRGGSQFAVAVAGDVPRPRPLPLFHREIFRSRPNHSRTMSIPKTANLKTTNPSANIRYFEFQE